MREVLAKRIELCGRNDDDSVIHSMLLLAECLHVVGKIGESVELLQAGLEELITKNGPEHPGNLLLKGNILHNYICILRRMCQVHRKTQALGAYCMKF